MTRRVGLAAALGMIAMATITGAELASGNTDEGRLVVHERAPKGYVYYEGYISYLTLRSLPGRRVVHHQRRAGVARLNREFPAGRYRLVFYLRPCVGTCHTVDRDVSERCSLRLRLRREQALVARVVHEGREPGCRIVRVR